MSNRKLLEYLFFMGACSDARRWVALNKFKSIQDAWDACDNTQWMLWYLRASAYGQYLRITKHSSLSVARACSDGFNRYIAENATAIERAYPRFAATIFRGYYNGQWLITAESYVLDSFYTSDEIRRVFTCPDIGEPHDWATQLSDFVLANQSISRLSYPNPLTP